MKKLFSKISAAMIGLFTLCVPAYAAKGGSLYINGKEAFRLSEVKEIEDMTDSNYEVMEICDNGHYKITDFRNSKHGQAKYILDSFDYDIIRCTAYNHYHRAGLKSLGSEKERLYHFQIGDHRMYEGILFDEGGKSRYDIESQVTRKLPFYFKRPGERVRVVRNAKSSCSTVFKIEYFKGKTKSENIMLDDEKKNQKRYAGYYIKDRKDNIVAKVTGSFFPPDAVLMLYLEDQLNGLF